MLLQCQLSNKHKNKIVSFNVDLLLLQWSLLKWWHNTKKYIKLALNFDVIESTMNKY